MNLLNYKDAKNIIIWLLMALIGLATYVYKSDQGALKTRYDEVISSVEKNNLSVLSSVEDMHKNLEEKVREVTTEQKQIKEGQQRMEIDVARLKALREAEHDIIKRNNP